MMVNDDVIKSCVGPKYRKFAPYLLTAFFFIFINNLMGLIPVFPGGANVTGNIAITMVLAVCTFLAVNIFGTKTYWKDIFWPDVPWRGTLHLNDELEILGVKEDVQKTVVTGIEMFRKQLDEAQAGDNIGALLRGINRDQIVRGQVLAKPGTVTCHHKFTAQVYVLTKDEGGRHTPFFNNYRPQFYFRTTDVTGVCNLPAGTEMCMPGDNIEMTIELIHPVAMEQGLTFAIREGGRTVGSGRVATIIE